jgi:hypothetical protein
MGKRPSPSAKNCTLGEGFTERRRSTRGRIMVFFKNPNKNYGPLRPVGRPPLLRPAPPPQIPPLSAVADVDPASPRDEEATLPHVPPEEVAPGDSAAPEEPAAAPGGRRARRCTRRETSPPLRPEGVRRRARREVRPTRQRDPAAVPGGEVVAALGGSRGRRRARREHAASPEGGRRRAWREPTAAPGGRRGRHTEGSRGRRVGVEDDAPESRTPPSLGHHRGGSGWVRRRI